MDVHIVNQLLSRLDEAIGCQPPPRRYITVGEESVNYLTAPYSEDEVIAIADSMIARAKAEQARRDRIIAWAEEQLQLGDDDETYG